MYFLDGHNIYKNVYEKKVTIHMLFSVNKKKTSSRNQLKFSFAWQKHIDQTSINNCKRKFFVTINKIVNKIVNKIETSHLLQLDA